LCTRNIEANAEHLAGLEVDVCNADVAAWIGGGLGETGDLILLDPPRAGLPEQVTDSLLTAGADALVLIGCDGMAFCRDIRRLAPKWRLEALSAIDLFPNTPQVEFVGLLKPIAL
jgi:23S rRNA (uracil1939-C5)-methyltransferase